jgi:hypothetical protein
MGPWQTRPSGISAARRERIEAAVAAAGQRLAQPFEARIAADPFRGGVLIFITGRQGFEKTVTVALGESPKRIARSAARRRMRSRREEAPPQPRGRARIIAVGGAGKGQSGRRISAEDSDDRRPALRAAV